MIIPTFRNEIEAAMYAERFKPLKTALDTPLSLDYARRYGDRTAQAAEGCRVSLARGHMAQATLFARSLSAILFHERPSLFETRERQPRAA